MSSRRRISAIAALLALCAAAYSGAFAAAFVFDDVGLIVNNARMGDLTRLGEWFTGDLWRHDTTGEPSGYYRPVFAVLLSLLKAGFGLNAAIFHLHGLLWHLVATGLLYALLARRVAAAGALAGAALFGLHPAQSEAVLWISANNDPVAAALCLGALLLAGAERAAASALTGAALCMAAAALAKESVLLMPAVFLVLERDRPDLWRRALPLLAGLGLAIGLRAVAGVGGAVWPDLARWKLFFGALPQVLGLGGSLLVWPWPLSVGRALEWIDVGPARVVLGLGVLVGLVALGWRRRVGLLWFVLALAPAVLAIASKGQLGERYLYLPMAGVAMVLAPHVRDSLTWRVGGGLAAGLSLLAIHSRAPDYSSERALWEAAAEDTPGPFSYVALASTLAAEGDRAAAADWYQRALRLDPVHYDACHRLVENLLATANPAGAARAGDWAAGRGCGENPRFVGAYAVALAFDGRWEQAEKALDANHAPDPQGRDQVVQAALTLIAGDLPGWARATAAWAGKDPLAPQVEKLLRLGGHPELVPVPSGADAAAQDPAHALEQRAHGLAPYCEPSAAVQRGEKVFIADNEGGPDEDQPLWSASTGEWLGDPPVNLRVPRAPKDVEALVLGQDQLWLVGSFSRNKSCESRPRRREIVKLTPATWDEAGFLTAAAESLRVVPPSATAKKESAAWDALEGDVDICAATLFVDPAGGRPVCQAIVSAARSGSKTSCTTLNIEAAAWIDGAVWLGLRAPLIDGDAILLRLAPGADQLRFDAWRRLPLAGQGVRELYLVGDTLWGIAGDSAEIPGQAALPSALFSLPVAALGPTAGPPAALTPQRFPTALPLSAEGLLLDADWVHVLVDGDMPTNTGQGCARPAAQARLPIP